MGRGRSRHTLDLVDVASEILQGIAPATIRAVCYQLFIRKILRSMAKSETNKVSRILRVARENGEIPWSWIVDEAREAERVSAWADPAAYATTVKRAYRRDRWADQTCRVEVWSEKGTVRGTLAPVLDAYGITFRVMHGYASATVAYDVAAESARDAAGGRPLRVLYVGDRDPSGMHMSVVDLPARIEKYGGQIAEFTRLAIVGDDTDNPNLPWFSVDEKTKDPRHGWYLERYGRRCWELDALSPVVLRERVEKAIVAYIDSQAWERAEVVERAELESLTTILDAWPGISRQAQQ
jgi:hypothetical protein